MGAKAAATPAQKAGEDEPGASQIRARLFDAENGNQEITDLDNKLGKSLAENQLLWIDLLDPSEAQLKQLAETFSLPATVVEGYLGTDTNPEFQNCGACFWLRVIAVDDTPGNTFSGTVLTMVAGKNLVVTLHRHPVEFLDTFRNGGSRSNDVGALGSGSFVAALLEWHLGTYFQAVSRFEVGVERLEVDILSPDPKNVLGELRSLRKGASRLRRMLAPHRVVFAALPRPDFRPDEDEPTQRHFRTLDVHYERAMDMVENARDLVVGSFELFSSQTALIANETMKLLTFATVVIGVLAVVGGILGMNFQAPFFKTGLIGFVVAVGAMLVLAVSAILFGRWRRWF